MLKHYVEFIYPGIMLSESKNKEIVNRNPKEISIPEGSFGFRFTDREEVELADGEILTGKLKNNSGWYYQGKKMSLEDVKREMPNEEILIDNMKCNGFKYIVWTKFGQAIPLYENDTVLL
jgi:hypothetical protein